MLCKTRDYYSDFVTHKMCAIRRQLLFYLHMWVCSFVYGHTCSCVHMKVRGQLWLSSFAALLLFLETRPLTDLELSEWPRLDSQIAPGICYWVWASPYQSFKNGFYGLNPVFCTLLIELSPQTKGWLLMWRLRALGLGWYWNAVKNAVSFLSELSCLWKKSTALSSTLWHSLCSRTVIFGFQSS